MSEVTILELVTPERLMLETEAKLVVVPGSDGDFGVLAKHSPMVSNIRPGVVNIYKDGLNAGITSSMFVAGGFAEVTGERCTILAEEAVDVSNIDASAAATRLSDAEKAVEGASSDGESKMAARELAIATAMVKAAA